MRGRNSGSWRSVDGGQSWQLTEFSTGKANPMISNLLRTAHGRLIIVGAATLWVRA